VKAAQKNNDLIKKIRKGGVDIALPEEKKENKSRMLRKMKIYKKN